MKIIALCGKRRVGKDTVADMLCENGFVRMRFADPLKMIVRTVFGFDEDQVENDRKDKVDAMWGVTPRLAMQVVGTELFQHELSKHIPGISRDVWAKTLLRQLEKPDAPQQVVISDMRFLHESTALRAWATEREVDLHILRIEREGVQQTADDAHASENECGMVSVDEVIVNGGSISDLWGQVRLWLVKENVIFQ